MLWPWNNKQTKRGVRISQYKVEARGRAEEISGTRGSHTGFAVPKTISTIITSLLPFLYSSEQSNDRNEASSIRGISFITISRNENHA